MTPFRIAHYAALESSGLSVRRLGIPLRCLLFSVLTANGLKAWRAPSHEKTGMAGRKPPGRHHTFQRGTRIFERRNRSTAGSLSCECKADCISRVSHCNQFAAIHVTAKPAVSSCSAQARAHECRPGRGCRCHSRSNNSSRPTICEHPRLPTLNHVLLSESVTYGASLCLGDDALQIQLADLLKQYRP